jgi:hypothetical protein
MFKYIAYNAVARMQCLPNNVCQFLKVQQRVTMLI